MQHGKHINNFSQELDRLQLAYGILLKKTKGGSVTYTAGHPRRALEAASKVFYKGDNSRMKSGSDYLTHSQDVVLKHYARTTYEGVKDACRAMVGVTEHKTSTTYPACIAFNGDQMQMMRDYMKYVRGEMLEDGTPDKSPFFRMQHGKHIKNFSQELDRLQLAYGILLKKTKGGSVTYTAGHARRTLEAASKVLYKGDNSRMKSGSDYLTHSQDVVLKHYARTSYEEVKDARRAMDSLIRGQSSQGP